MAAVQEGLENDPLSIEYLSRRIVVEVVNRESELSTVANEAGHMCNIRFINVTQKLGSLVPTSTKHAAS